MPTREQIDKMLAAKEAMTPESGFNLVGLDDYEKPGEELYFIAHFDKKDDADAEQKKRAEDNSGEKMFVYGSDA